MFIAMYGSTQWPQSTKAVRPSQTPGVHWPKPTVTETPRRQLSDS